MCVWVTGRVCGRAWCTEDEQRARLVVLCVLQECTAKHTPYILRQAHVIQIK